MTMCLALQMFRTESVILWGNPSWDLRKIPPCALLGGIKCPSSRTPLGSSQIPGYNNCLGFWPHFGFVPDLKAFLCLYVTG